MTVQRHSHSGRGGDAERISYNNLINKPVVVPPPVVETVKYFQVNDTRWTSGLFPGNYTVTCGFRPKRIDIKASGPISNQGFSTGTALVDENSVLQNGCVYQDGATGNNYLTDGTKAIAIKAGSSTMTAYVSSITDTGFVLTVDNSNWTFNTIITVQG